MMTQLSRRGFMQLTGLGAALTLPEPFRYTSVQPFPVRVLNTTVLRSQSSHTAKYLQQLLPDTVHRASAIVDDWVRIQSGYVAAADVQPMLQPALSDVTTVTTQTWVEVIAPYTALRRYAAPVAPLVLRANHGDVFCLSHSFHDDAGIWWAQTKQGWLQAAHVRRIPQQPEPHLYSALMLMLDLHRQQVTVLENNQVLATLSANFPERLPSGLKLSAFVPGTEKGRPWNVILGNECSIHGEGSHNVFGKNTRLASGYRVELATVAARWLYYTLAAATDVTVCLRT